MAMRQAEQDPNLPHLASNVLSPPNVNHLRLTVAGQAEVPAAGQVNFKDSLPRSTSNVLEPMLHPVLDHKVAGSYIWFQNYISVQTSELR